MATPVSGAVTVSRRVLDLALGRADVTTNTALERWWGSLTLKWPVRVVVVAPTFRDLVAPASVRLTITLAWGTTWPPWLRVPAATAAASYRTRPCVRRAES